MDINLEKGERHSIQSYDKSQITVNQIQYDRNTIISRDQITSNWHIEAQGALTEQDLLPLLDLNPEVILIGYDKKHILITPPLLNELSKRRIGIECMSIGAACRTFNILLNESRRAVLGIIF